MRAVLDASFVRFARYFCSSASVYLSSTFAQWFCFGIAMEQISHQGLK